MQPPEPSAARTHEDCEERWRVLMVIAEALHSLGADDD